MLILLRLRKGKLIAKLFEVMAKIIQENDKIIYINSNFADYNKINNNTIFKENVNVKYDQLIDADIINLDFSKNLIKVEENVFYKNNNAEVNADKIEIDIKSKKLKISMNKQKDRIKIFKIIMSVIKKFRIKNFKKLNLKDLRKYPYILVKEKFLKI